MLKSPSSLFLVAVNLLPIGGVVWFGWSVLELLLLYWTESVAIGVINVLRMLASNPASPLAGFAGSNSRIPDAAREALATSGARRAGQSLKFFLVPFFVIHYGAFCFAHLTAVVSIFANGRLTTDLFGALPTLTDPVFWWVVSFIFCSHLYSFFANFIGQGEFRRTGVAALMQRPYGRIMVMHITVILGAALIEWLDSPLPMLFVLVAAKTVVDLKYHERERERFGPTVFAG